MSKRKNFPLFLGRIIIGFFFIFMALFQILNWQYSEKILSSKLSDWQSFALSGTFKSFFILLYEWAPAILLFLIFIELVGGILIFLNKKIKFASFILIIFFSFITLIYHPFWFLNYLEKKAEMVLFFKNIAILSAILLVIGSKEQKKQKIPIKINKPPLK